MLQRRLEIVIVMAGAVFAWYFYKLKMSLSKRKTLLCLLLLESIAGYSFGNRKRGTAFDGNCEMPRSRPNTQSG